MIISKSLELIFRDIVNSERFKKLIEDALIPERNLYYTQFMMNIWERKRLIQRSYISPPLLLIDSILEQVKKIIFTCHINFLSRKLT